MSAFVGLPDKVWPFMLWTLAPKCRCIIQEDWSRTVLSITSGYMVPITNYTDLNYISKLYVHQEMWVPQQEDKENQCTQWPGQSALASRQALRTVFFLENFPAKAGTCTFMWISDMKVKQVRKNTFVGLIRLYAREKHRNESPLQSKPFWICAKVEPVEKCVRFRNWQVRW